MSEADFTRAAVEQRVDRLRTHYPALVHEQIIGAQAPLHDDSASDRARANQRTEAVVDQATNPLAIIIAGGGEAAARAATAAVQSAKDGSPLANARAARAARAALKDREATFTVAERRQIARVLAGERRADIRLRVTPGEKSQVQAMAEEAGCR